MMDRVQNLNDVAYCIPTSSFINHRLEVSAWLNLVLEQMHFLWRQLPRRMEMTTLSMVQKCGYQIQTLLDCLLLWLIQIHLLWVQMKLDPISWWNLYMVKERENLWQLCITYQCMLCIWFNKSWTQPVQLYSCQVSTDSFCVLVFVFVVVELTHALTMLRKHSFCYLP